MKSYKDHDLHSTVQSFTTLTSFFEEKTLVMRKRNKNGLISIRTIIQRIHTTTCPDKNKQLSLHSKQNTTDSAVIYSIDLELVILTSAPMMKKVGLLSMYYKISKISNHKKYHFASAEGDDRQTPWKSG